ncbi:MAG: NAD(P)-dependent oxidoreductase [Thermoleophilaceae bacterium]|nr:NAD(P)-dependent oxidoreductase [Thermoleophilaceae bacterium]
MSEKRKAESVAILGAGIIGAAMARNTVRAGISTAVWNRSPERARPLAADGAEVFESAAEAVRDRDVVISVLSDAQVTLEVMAPLLGELAEGAAWLQCATIGVDGTDALIAMAEEAGVKFVDVPVSGTKNPAEAGQLVMLASGDKAAAEFAAPVLDAVGAKTVWLGEAGNGSRMKLVTNHWVLTQTAMIAEAMHLCSALGLDPDAFLDAIDGAPVGSAYAQIKGRMMLDGNYEPNFPLEHGTKDTRLIVGAAREAGLQLPLAEGTNDHFNAALAAGRGKDDVSAIFEYVAQRRSGA